MGTEGENELYQQLVLLSAKVDELAATISAQNTWKKYIPYAILGAALIISGHSDKVGSILTAILPGL